MKRSRKIDAKEVGLEFTTIVGRYFLKSDLLHYGYWADGLEHDITNIRAAQEAYSRLLAESIPDGTKTVLDVGCGTGAVAEGLLGEGYEVDCVSPGPFLTARVRERLDGRSHIFECRYEDLRTERRYDLILFSESFQYVDLESALDQSLRLLKPGGHIMICDVFNNDVPGGGALAGGHKLTRFLNEVGRRPFEQLRDFDITKQTAPNLALADEMNTKVVKPIWELVQKVIATNYPLLNRILRWKFKEKIRRFNRKFTSGRRNAENFMTHRTYRLLVYRKTGEPSPG